MSTTGAIHRKRNGDGNPASIKVVMYHQIVEDDHAGAPAWYRLPVQKFRDHLTWLDRRGFTTITLEDYRLYQSGILSLPKRPIILTFDDGYRDNYTLAFPLLKHFGMKAVMFVLGNRKITANTWDRDLTPSGAALMNDQEIIDMHESGFEIGAHSFSHVRLTELPTSTAWEEIYYSRMRLEAILNAPVRSFAYPYGFVNEKIKTMVVDAGYTHACSVFSGPPAFDADSFEIRRMTIADTTGPSGLGLRLFLPYSHYEWARWKTVCAIKSLQRKFRTAEFRGGRDSNEIPVHESH